MLYIYEHEALHFRKLLDKCADGLNVDETGRFVVITDRSAIVSNLIDAIVFMLGEHLSPCGSCGAREGLGPDCCDECTDRPECLRMPTEGDARAVLVGAVDSIVHWDESAVSNGRSASVIGGIEYDPRDR